MIILQHRFQSEARKDYDTLLRHTPKDAILLFERSLVHLQSADVDSLLTDLEVRWIHFASHSSILGLHYPIGLHE